MLYETIKCQAESCGLEFVPSAPNQKYCSVQCYNRAYRRRRTARGRDKALQQRPQPIYSYEREVDKAQMDRINADSQAAIDYFKDKYEGGTVSQDPLAPTAKQQIEQTYLTAAQVQALKDLKKIGGKA